MMLFPKKFRPLILALLILAGLIAAVYLVGHCQQEFSRQNLRPLLRFIRPFGSSEPVIVIFLIFLSTAIPPLPLPVPLIEIAAGLTLGFQEGFLVVWISQVTSSLFAFYLARLVAKTRLGRVLNYHAWDSYRAYLKKKGTAAVLITRLTMSAPFNIISYLAGLMQISPGSFTLATAVGTIPESLIYAYLGSKIRLFRASLWLILTLIVIVGLTGFAFTLSLMNKLQPADSIAS